MSAGGEKETTVAQEPRRVLVVAAHPDDIDVNAGGTLRRWAVAGDEIAYLIVTSGDAGQFDGAPRGEVMTARRAEQRAAADITGVHDVRFLDGYRDGDVQACTELVKDIVRVIRQVRPHVVMTLSPERRWDRPSQYHPDHLAVGEATVRAVYPAAGNPHAFPDLSQESLREWDIDELWIQDPPHPNHAEDVSDVVADKYAAVLAHNSQFPRSDEAENALSERMRRDAVSFGLPDGALAELFLRVSL